ncbi:MAG: AAA family ATPase [Dehalococcoidales bacterium]|nr:AAA family ATPase [Dehalococcoidales bacterium]
MNTPEIEKTFDGYKYTWSEDDLVIEVSKLKNDGKCEISVSRLNGNIMQYASFNLLTLSTRTNLAAILKKDNDAIDWNEVLTNVSTITLKKLREGEALEAVWPDENDTLEAEYLLEPILYFNHPTVVFGDYGSAKSLLSLIIAYIIQRPSYYNRLDLITTEPPINSLFLDWEDEKDTFRKRWSAISNGFKQDVMPIYRRKMTAPLADSVDQIQKQILEEDIKLLIVDSLGPAARGNLNDPEPAIRYHAALRELGITSLTLAHTSKDQLNKNKTIFGSVFFTNLARAVWECKSEQETGEDELVISLKQTKANLSKKHTTLGYKFEFTYNTVSIAKADLLETGLSVELSLKDRIKNLLKHERMTTKNLADILDAKEGSVKTTLNRNKNLFIKIDDTWAIRSYDEA